LVANSRAARLEGELTALRSHAERIDLEALHLSGEFAEQNLGTTVDSAGSITVRVVVTQFMFVPRCVAVPRVGAPCDWPHRTSSMAPSCGRDVRHPLEARQRCDRKRMRSSASAEVAVCFAQQPTIFALAIMTAP
jgi:hypothetical protein